MEHCELKGRNFLTLLDFTPAEIESLLDLAADLKVINDECWLDKKHQARRMGESVQNRLFVPTMLMFVGILVVIVVPAMAGFSF